MAIFPSAHPAIETRRDKTVPAQSRVAPHARDSLKSIQSIKLHLHLEKSSDTFLPRDFLAMRT